MSDVWVERMREIVFRHTSSKNLTQDIMAELLAERDRYDALHDQFIKHRTATHEVAPIFCKTCQESDVVLYG